MPHRTSKDDVVMTPVQIEGRRWRSPVVVTRMAIFIYSAAIALCFVAVIGFGIWYLLDRRSQVNERAEEQKVEITQLREITAHLQEIENPTPEQFRARLKEGIERCLKEPSCKALFPTIDDNGGQGG